MYNFLFSLFIYAVSFAYCFEYFDNPAVGIFIGLLALLVPYAHLFFAALGFALFWNFSLIAGLTIVLHPTVLSMAIALVAVNVDEYRRKQRYKF